MMRVMLLLAGLACLLAAPAEARKPVAFGDTFPALTLTAPEAASDAVYLGVAAGKPFNPTRLHADLLVVEMLNVHCPHCQMQTASYNELFKLIQQDDSTRGRILMLGLAIGNVPDEVAAFRQAFRVPFPVLPDRSFSAWRAIGGTATPFTIYIRLDPTGGAPLVVGTHLGLNTHYQQVFRELKRLADTDIQELRRQGRRASAVRTAIEPILSPEELEYRVRTAFVDAGGILLDMRPVDLPSGRRVYVATLRRGDKLVRLFAEVTSRQSICDICHDVHFIYVFDSQARVVAFEPIQLTKWGNVNWDSTEVERMRKKVVGSTLTAPPVFDPKVDAVTSATMTSAIIFDSLAQGESLLRELEQKGLWPAR